MNQDALCRIDEIPDPGSVSFSVTIAGEACDIFIVCKHGRYFAYRNSCPHTGGPLDWQLNRFLDNNDEYILCSNHMAGFRIDDGFCLSGPCVEQSLWPVSISIEQHQIFLDE